MNNKKYSSNIEQVGESWTAQIVRQVSKQKVHVSTQKDGFANEAKAQAWAAAKLEEFISTQKQANSRQGEQRRENEEMKRLRSERRSEKTKLTKEDNSDIEESIDPKEGI